MSIELINIYRERLDAELSTDENADYRRGFYAGSLMALLEAQAASKPYVAMDTEGMNLESFKYKTKGK